MKKKITYFSERIQKNKSKLLKCFIGTTLLPIMISAGVLSSLSLFNNSKNFNNESYSFLGRVQLAPLKTGLNSKDTAATSVPASSEIKIKFAAQEKNFNNNAFLTSALNQAVDSLSLGNKLKKYDNFFVSYEKPEMKRGELQEPMYNLVFQGDLQDKDNFYFINWLKHIHFNQLSIDQYTHIYNETGAIDNHNSPLKLNNIVVWNNINPDLIKFIKPTTLMTDGAIEFNIYDKDIASDVLTPLINEDTNKYQILHGSNQFGSNDWFVWLDKDLLALKLNYIYQTYIFNQNEAATTNKLQEIIGIQDTDVSKEKSQNKEELNRNYEKLTTEEKKFAQDYLKIIVNSNATTSINWSDAAEKALNNSDFIKSQDLNKIYNSFSRNNGSLKLFDGHLINRIVAGSSGNWKNFLPKYDTNFNTYFKEKGGVNAIVPIRSLNAQQKIVQSDDQTSQYEVSTSSTKIQEKKPLLNEDNKLRIYVDNKINSSLNTKKLFHLIKDQSIRYFSLKESIKYKDKNSQISEIQMPILALHNSEKLKQNFAIISLSKAPSFNQINQTLLITAEQYKGHIAVIVTLILSIGIIVSVLYRVPGIIAWIFQILGIIFAFSLYRYFDMPFTNDALVGLLSGSLIGLFVFLYGRNYLKNNFNIHVPYTKSLLDYLKKSNKFGFDLLINIFVIATVFSFIQISTFKNFAIALGIAVLSNYFWSVLVGIGCIYYLKNWYSQKYYLFWWKKEWIFSKKNTVTRSRFGNFDYQTPLFKFGWQQITGIGLCVLVVMIGISLVFSEQIGFANSFLFKKGHLIHLSINQIDLQENSTIENVKTALTLSQIQEKIKVPVIEDKFSIEGSLFFRTTEAFNVNTLIKYLKTYLLPGSYSVIETSAFSNTTKFINLFILFVICLVLISIHSFVQYLKKAIIILWSSFFVMNSLLFALLTITRIPVDENLILCLLSFFVINLYFYIWYNNAFTLIFNKKFNYDNASLKRMFQAINKENICSMSVFIGLIWTFTLILFSATNFLNLQFLWLYLIYAVVTWYIVIVCYLTQIYYWLIKQYQKCFYHFDSINKKSDLKFKVKNFLDVDEEDIEGINC